MSADLKHYVIRCRNAANRTGLGTAGPSNFVPFVARFISGGNYRSIARLLLPLKQAQPPAL